MSGHTKECEAQTRAHFLACQCDACTCVGTCEGTRTRGRGRNVRADSALFIGDAPDGVLGTRGALGEGARPLLYAWCERERLYHYTSARRGAHNAVHPGRWTTNVAQPKRDVTVRTPVWMLTNPEAYGYAYDARRVAWNRAPMVRGAGNGARADHPPVALTQATRRALARVNEWSTADGRAQGAADWRALCARIAARDAA